MSAEEAMLARQALRAAEGCARRLRRSHDALGRLFPLTAEALHALDPIAEDGVDALLKRYEQLVLTVQEELFLAVAALGGEDIRSLARREVTELMARLGALPAADRFRTVVAIRNRITHVYPDDPDRQARNLNEAYATVPELLGAYESVRRYLERRLPGIAS